jgi:hypothetical protein
MKYLFRMQIGETPAEPFGQKVGPSAGDFKRAFF